MAIFNGSNGADVFAGTVVADSAYGNGGNDTLNGAEADDRLDGGEGDDLLDGGIGMDILLGRAGNDVLSGRDGDDRIAGGDGNDYLRGESNNREHGNDFIDGGAGKDTIYGGNGNDTLSGGDGNDRIFSLGNGNGEYDIVDGGAGNDYIEGYGLIDGGAGDDTIVGGGTLSYASATNGVVVSLAVTGPQDTGAGLDTISGFYSLVGSAYGDRLTSNAAAGTLSGGGGNDTLIGGGTLEGGDGSDIIIVWNGNPGDHLDGGAGAYDVVSYEHSYAGVTVSLAPGVLGQGGEAGGNTMTGVERLWGSAFNDRLTGYTDNNQLLGQDGNDRLDGDAGNDTIEGGMGADYLTGDLGADRFVYRNIAESTRPFASRDTISDFSHAEGDKIDLSAIDAKVGAGNDAFTFVAAFTGKAGELEVVASGADWLVWGDVDGDKKVDFAILVKSETALTATDFIL